MKDSWKWRVTAFIAAVVLLITSSLSWCSILAYAAPAVFYYIGKFFELSYVIKSLPGGNALRRQGRMSLKRPAAGGESRERDSLFWRGF